MRNYNTSQFLYDKASNTFTSEMSDLQMASWPATITLTSAKTGRVIWCELVKVHRDIDGDVTHVEYSARRNSGMDLPALGEPNFRVVIFND